MLYNEANNIRADVLMIVVAIFLFAYGAFFGLRSNLPKVEGDRPVTDISVGFAGGILGGLAMVRVTVDDMISELHDLRRDGEPVLQDPVVRDQLVQAVMEEKALALGNRRAGITPLTTDYPGSLPLSHKLRISEMTRRMRQLAISLQGAEGALYVGDKEARQGGFWQRAYFNSFSATIGGGTSQVQANIVAEHILGLPK